jgi:hypothetical protein
MVRGHAIAEAYVAAQATTGVIAPQIIPADCYFVLGDNRADSLDSRSWGVLPRASVLGRARMILWSSDGPVGRRELGIAGATPFPASEGRGLARGGSPSNRLFKFIQ